MKFLRSVEAIRTKSTTEDKLRDFYGRLDDQIKTKGIGPSRIHNIDKHGLAKGETKHGKVKPKLNLIKVNIIIQPRMSRILKAPRLREIKMSSNLIEP